MSSKTLSEALSHISDEKLWDAINVYERKKRRRMFCFRVAAAVVTVAIVLCAVLTHGGQGIVTGNAGLTVYAYDLTDDPYVRCALDEDTVSAPLWWCPALNYICGLPITLDVSPDFVPEAEITLDVSTDYGKFYGHPNEEKYKEMPLSYIAQEDLGGSFTITNGETIFWSLVTVEEHEAICANDGFYVDVILRGDGNIIGCGVIHIVSKNGQMDYAADGVRSVGFPQVDGAYQNVTEEYARQVLAELREGG